MRVYTRRDTEVFTEEGLKKFIRQEENFSDYIEQYINDNYSFMEIFNHLEKDFQEQLKEETISDVIFNEYYENHLNT